MRLISSFTATLRQAWARLMPFFHVSGRRRQAVVLTLAFSLLALPFSLLPSRLAAWFNSKKPQARAETIPERTARVSHLRLSPTKYVGYVNQQMTFAALPSDVYGEAVHGARLSWDTADSTTVNIDDSGRATFLKAGLAWVICRVGSAENRLPVLVRSGPRPPQTDAQWLADQNSLSESGTVSSTGSSGSASLFDAIMNHLMPTAEAQNGGGSLDYLWNDLRNLTGAPPHRLIEATRAGIVLPEGSNFNLNVPLVNLQGRGFSVVMNLAYNSRIWQRNSNLAIYNPLPSYPSTGYYLGFGYLVTYTSSYSPYDTGYLLMDSTGTPHYLGHGSATTSGSYQTQDGTHISFTGSASIGGTLSYNDGSKVTISIVNNNLLPTQIEDRNGNYIQIAYKDSSQGYSPLALDYVTDTEGRSVQFTYDTNKNLTAISLPAPGSGTQTVAQFDYQNHLFKYTFSGLTVSGAPTSGSQVSTLRHIYLPATGTGFLLSYSDYGMVYNVSWRRGMSGPTTDGTESAAVNFNYPTSGTTTLTDSPAFTQRSESATNATTGTYTYTNSSDSVAKTLTYTITQPDSSTLNLTRSTDSSSLANGLLTKSEIKTSGGASMLQSIFTYANDPAGFAQVQSVKTIDDTSAASKVDFDYDSSGNITNQREYGQKINNQFVVRRRTHFVYTSAGGANNLVSERDLYDAQQDTNDANDVLIGKVTYTYDNYQAMNGMEGYTGKPLAPGHDSAFTTSVTNRGNVTGMSEWYDLANNLSITHLKKYDLYGNVVQEQVSCCNVKSYTLSDATNYAQPDAVVRGDNSGVHLTESMVHDFNSGLTTSQTDPNSETTTLTYDAATRPASVTTPTGAQGTWSYNDSALTASSSMTYTDNGTQKTVSTSQEVDGWGRVIKSYNIHGGQVNTTYDGMGRVSAVSNPFTAGGSPSYWTNYQYDALGRVTTVTSPDNNTVQSSYSGLVVTMTDQVGRQIKRTSDSLGRLVTVTEPDVSTGTLNQDTTYSYNLLDKLTGVNQGNQTRSWQYDDLGRMTTETIPEQTPKSPNTWTTKYTYTAFSAVATKTDARGVVTSYSYDTLNRLTQVSYDTSGATGVASTSAVIYNYDNVSTSATFGKLLSVQVGSSYQESYAYDSYLRPTSVTRVIDSKSYQTSYQYNQASQSVQLTYPSGYSFYTNFDSQGRVQSLTSLHGGGNGYGTQYVSGLSYNVAGQVTGLTMANGVAETYGYDAQRLQMTTQTATSGATSLLSLTYNYSATAGQSGTGTTAGNSGQLMSISGTINGSTESANYNYDDLGRLVTSNQTTNGTAAQRRFAYDRWGNRTAVYDATSGGTQIQSVTLQQVNSVPTNRLTSVTNSGTTLNYSYDNNGNVTNDGVHSYTYDAENRVVSVDSGTTASYGYDHQNRRIKKTVGSTITHYVWQGDQVIAEHNGSTGTEIVNYTYAGRRMINKTQSSTTNYFLSDRLSARVVMDTSGNIVGKQSHLPFGEEFGGSGTTDKHKFTSYERDSESGLDYAINRQNNESLGRFTAVDPKSASAKKEAPQSWNRYAYSLNDPTNMRDPLGLEGFEGQDPLALPDDSPCRPFGPDIIYDDFMGPMDRFTYCFLNSGPIADGSGGDDHSEQGLIYSDLSFRVTDFFSEKSNCFTYFLKKGIYNDFVERAANAQYIDFNILSNASYALSPFHNTFGSIGLTSNANRNALIVQTLSQPVRNPNTGNLNFTFAATFIAENTITIGANFYLKSVPDQNETIVHEVLHLYYNADNHRTITEQLMGKMFDSDGAAGIYLDLFLNSDCTYFGP